MPLQLRRGTQPELNDITPLEGELIYVRPTPPSTSPKLYVGDGTTQGGILVTGLNENDAKNATGETFTEGTHVGITFDYDSVNRVINATVDLSEARFNSINGSVVANDSTILVNADTGVITATSLNVDGAVITSDGLVIDLPSGSTIDGDLIGLKLGSDDSTTVTIANGTTVPFLGGTGITTNIDNGALKINATGTVLNPRVTSGADSATHYIPLVANFSGESEVRAAGTLNYIPSTGTLAVPTINCDALATLNITGVQNVGTVLVTTGQVQSVGGELVLSSQFDVVGNAARRMVQVGSGLIDGRFSVVTNTYFGTSSFCNFTQSHNTADVANFQFTRSRNTTAAPGTVLTGDDIADIAFSGHNGTIPVNAAILTVRVNEVLPGAAGAGGVVTAEYDFYTQRKDVSPTSGPTLAVTIDDKQTTKFFGALKFAVYANPSARDAALTVGSSSAPGAPRTGILEPGMVVFVTDSTGMGGPAKLQCYDGTGWQNLF